MPKKIIVGIVSKRTHSASHRAALESKGFTVRDLDARPAQIPKRVDLLVCRTASCSHGASGLCFEWGRRDTNKGRLCVSNSLEEIVRFCTEWRTAQVAEKKAGKSVNLHSASGAIRYLFETCGFYRVGMADRLTVYQIVGIAGGVGAIKADETQAYTDISTALVALRGSNRSSQRRRVAELHRASAEHCLTSDGAPGDSVLCKNDRIRRQIEGISELAVLLGCKPWRKEVPVEEAPEAVTVEEPLVPEAAAPPPLPEAHNPAPEAVPEVAPEAVPEVTPEAVSEDPMAGVEEAIRLLHSYMKDASVTHIVLTQTDAKITQEIHTVGSFNFERL